MAKTATKTKPALWKRIVSRIKSQASHGTRAGQWSGRKAQAAVKAYKKAEKECPLGNEYGSNLLFKVFLIFLFTS